MYESIELVGSGDEDIVLLNRALADTAFVNEFTAEEVTVPETVRAPETLGEVVAVAEIDDDLDALELRESVWPAVALRNDVVDLAFDALVV